MAVGRGYFWSGLAGTLGDIKKQQSKEKQKNVQMGMTAPYYSALTKKLETGAKQTPYTQQRNSMLNQIQDLLIEKAELFPLGTLEKKIRASQIDGEIRQLRKNVRAIDVKFNKTFEIPIEKAKEQEEDDLWGGIK